VSWASALHSPRLAYVLAAPASPIVGKFSESKKRPLLRSSSRALTWVSTLAASNRHLEPVERPLRIVEDREVAFRVNHAAVNPAEDITDVWTGSMS
jgi:hypothetical protein